MRESLLVLFEEDADGEYESPAVPIHQILDDTIELFFEENLAILLESSSLEQDLSQGYPIVLLLDVRPILVEIVDIFLGIDEPILDLDLVLVHDDDAAGRESSVYDIALVEGSDAFDDWSESVANLLLIEMYYVVAPLPIFDLCLQRRLLLRVQQTIVVANGPEEGGVTDGRIGLHAGTALEILIGLLGGFVEEEDVVRLEFYYDELFTG